MHVITLAGSEHQKSRLRNGHKVRVKHGAGFNVIVSPDTYHLVSRAFIKNKGTTLQLSPEEITMNKAPSPEMQRQIMGHNEHLILPNPMGALVKGSGIGDWFNNIGNQIKSGFEEKIINPVKEKIINPAMDLYNKNVPEDVRRDINTGLKFSSPAGLLASTIDRVRKGEKIQDVMRDYGDDLKHLNNTKNKIIKSSPVLTEAYKKGVPALAGIATGALGSAFGLSPITGALVGAAGAKGADELLKAEGYGLHKAIEIGEKHHYHKLKHHRKPIGGALKWSHITNFFKNAGHAIQKAAPVVKQGAQMAHNFLLNNPKLAAKVKEHGSKLAGMLAKAGINYITGNEKYGDQAEQMGTKLADEQIHQKLGYGMGDDKARLREEASRNNPNNRWGNARDAQRDARNASNAPVQGMGLTSGQSSGGNGLYAGKMRGRGDVGNGGVPSVQGLHRLQTHMQQRKSQGTGFNSYHTLKEASDAYAHANDMLANMSKHTIHNQHTQRPISKYYDADGSPPSRGTGVHPHNAHHIHQDNHLHQRIHVKHPHDNHNLIRGRGTLIEHDTHLPQALTSQPYGANFHMQFQLPPQYQKYNDGTYTY